jgi:hypothetical protein
MVAGAGVRVGLTLAEGDMLGLADGVAVGVLVGLDDGVAVAVAGGVQV